MTSRIAEIEDFLAQRRIAFVGLSRDERDFSHAVWKAFADRGYDLVPVHPEADVLEGRPVYAEIGDIPDGVDAALLMTPPERSETVVRQCAAAGVQRVWLHAGAGPGAVSDGALAAAETAGLHVVAGQCPMMFLRDAGFGHRVHGFFKQMTGSYPA